MIKQTVLAVAISVFSSSALGASSTDLNGLAHSAQSGDVVAQIQLGNMYANGTGDIHRSYSEALRWFSMAAEQGSALAQYNLALLFENGLGTERSLADAATWYQRAAHMGHAGAQLNLGYIYEHGLGVNQSMTRAKELYMAAANSGDPVAQHNLGLMLVSEGMGVPQHEAAFEWFQQSAESGHVPAQYSLGLRFLNGLGTSRSTREAVNWLARAAEANHAPSQHLLGDIYRTGQYMEPSPAWSIYYYEQAAGQGHAESQFELARLHLDGDDASDNLIDITNLLVSAAKSNHAGAQSLLENMVSDWETLNVASHQDFSTDVGDIPARLNVSRLTLHAGPESNGRRPAVYMHRLVSGSIAASTNETASTNATAGNQRASVDADTPARAAVPSEDVVVRRIGASNNKPSNSVSEMEITNAKPARADSNSQTHADDGKLVPGRYSVRRPVNLRRDAASWSELMGRVEAGEIITLIEDVGYGWAKVQVGEDTVHMMSRVLYPVE